MTIWNIIEKAINMLIDHGSSFFQISPALSRGTRIISIPKNTARGMSFTLWFIFPNGSQTTRYVWTFIWDKMWFVPFISPYFLANNSSIWQSLCLLFGTTNQANSLFKLLSIKQQDIPFYIHKKWNRHFKNCFKKWDCNSWKLLRIELKVNEKRSFRIFGDLWNGG